jgi:hypothetical protein
MRKLGPLKPITLDYHQFWECIKINLSVATIVQRLSCDITHVENPNTLVIAVQSFHVCAFAYQYRQWLIAGGHRSFADDARAAEMESKVLANGDARYRKE